MRFYEHGTWATGHISCQSVISGFSAINALQATLLKLQLNLSATVIALGRAYPSLESEIETERQQLLKNPEIKAVLEALEQQQTVESQKLLAFFSGPLKGPIQ
jgi:hypothetical protein